MKKLNLTEIEDRLEKLNEWEYIDGALETTLKFKNFKEAFSAMAQIAFECEIQNHHPDWRNVYNSLTIRLNTHDANGVTEKDFKLANTIAALPILS